MASTVTIEAPPRTGSSLRAIAGAVKTSHETVRKDQVSTRLTPGSDPTPKPPVKGLDGKTYPAKQLQPKPSAPAKSGTVLTIPKSREAVAKSVAGRKLSAGRRLLSNATRSV